MFGMGYDGLNVSHNPHDTRNLHDCNTHGGRITQSGEGRVAKLNAGPIIDRMQKVVGVSTDIALGKHFGHSTSAVSGWRNRNKVPYEECMILASQKGVSLDWLLLGIGQRDIDAPAYAQQDSASMDPRMTRLVGFLANWNATRSEDDKVWLEMQLARSVPEYAEWIAARSRGN